jgi:drug/metabolite transporter (DMT)-like permease
LTIVIRHIGVVRANVFTNLIPIMTGVLSYFMIKEQFSSLKILAMIIVIFGLFISQLHRFDLKIFSFKIKRT